jgi:hypothetical protein
MKIRLLNYADKEHFVEIPDDTKEITIEIISGDMVLTSPIHYDTCPNGRMMNFYDGTVVLDKKDFGRLETIKESYDLLNKE